MDVHTALQEGLKTALVHDGPARGNVDAAKALEQRHLCVLASTCDEPVDVQWVDALCARHHVDRIQVDDRQKLGEWAGLCTTDRAGKPRKGVGCSCAVVKDYGKESQAKDVTEEYFKCQKKRAEHLVTLLTDHSPFLGLRVALDTWSPPSLELAVENRSRVKSLCASNLWFRSFVINWSHFLLLTGFLD
ncbi:40S ribosomal protein S12-like [Echinops telfairi]|uniref:40S ribosomal protein S12-like n=1 Tax=Echinops telfairi TaxID=9371 RepID=A0AC55CYU8_ECHTE|nr:40S ribosomal protein S12-like [Echinops telfairi]